MVPGGVDNLPRLGPAEGAQHVVHELSGARPSAIEYTPQGGRDSLTRGSRPPLFDRFGIVRGSTTLLLPCWDRRPSRRCAARGSPTVGEGHEPSTPGPSNLNQKSNITILSNLAINATKMAPKKSKRLQERAWDNPTNGLLWSAGPGLEFSTATNHLLTDANQMLRTQ